MNQTEKYYGNYLGIVVRSDDPEGRNRLKIFIPHISATLYETWNKDPEDKIFNFLDSGSAQFGKAFEELRIILPWAECAAPLIGSVSGGRHVAQPAQSTSSPFGGGQSGGGSKQETSTIADGNQTLADMDTNTNSTLAEQRKALFADQLQDPATRNALFTRTSIEVGDTNQAAQTAFMESVLNRAACRNMSIIGAVDNHDHYYPPSDDSRFAAGTSKDFGGVLNNVGNGSNVSNFSTGNASGGVGVGEHRVTIGGEDFGTETPDAACIAKIAGGTPITEKPAYNVEQKNPTDGFTNSQVDPVRRANAFGNNYAAHAYSNVAKGLFSTPNVGAHLWCFFQEGDPMKPVYFAASFGASDYAGVRSGGSYTSAPKDKSNENPGPDNTQYQGDLILNERGGAIAIRSSDNRPGIDVVDHYGSNIRMGERGTSLYSAHNHQHLVAKDSFLTVNNDRNVVVRNHYDLVVYGDILRKVGHTNSYLETYKKIKDLISDTAKDMTLYERKRADAHLADQGRSSSKQTKSGSYAKCPVCTPGETYSAITATADSIDLGGMTPSQAQLFEVAPTITKGQSSIQTRTFGTAGQIFGSKCLTCNGSGESPSSEQGNWEKDSTKEQAAQKMVQQIDQLADLEKNLGPGGSEIITVAKDYTITVGLLLNDLPAVRTDVAGKLVPRGMKVGKQGVYRDKQQAPIMEIAPQHPAFPGGNYDLSVMNRYNVQVGAGGIFLKTRGVVQLGGVMTNLNGDQILITSANETKITGGKSFSVAADLVTLAPNNAGQVMVDGGLAVARNMIVAGGLHVEGELSVHHITAPLEYQLTELQSPGGLTVTDAIIGYVLATPGETPLPVTGSGIPDTIVVDAHRHYFANLPLSLMNTSDDVRSSADANNKSEAVTPNLKYTAGTAFVPITDPA